MVEAPDKRLSPYLKALNFYPSQLAPIIHIAGTNGKGSTLFYLKQLLETAGKKVHSLTSPHLFKIYERIELAGKPITPEHYHRLEAEIGSHKLCESDFYTLLALLAFSKNRADFILLETGLGGRLDSTNLSTLTPILIIMTPVSLDHQEILGNSIEEIIEEKIGIFKKGVPTIVAAQRHQDRIERQVLGDLIPLVEKKEISEVAIHLENFQTALTAFHYLLPNHACNMIRPEEFPGRMQDKSSAFQKYFGYEKHHFWIDGAHNQAGLEVLNSFMPEAYIIPHFKKDAANKLSLLKIKTQKPYLLFEPDGSDFLALEIIKTYCEKEEIPYLYIHKFQDFLKEQREERCFIFCGSLEVPAFYIKNFVFL